MKKFLLVFLAVLGLSLAVTSCQPAEEEPVEPTTPAVDIDEE